jgi:hypothetical protein
MQNSTELYLISPDSEHDVKHLGRVTVDSITWLEAIGFNRPDIKLSNLTEDDLTVTINVNMSEEDHATAMKFFGKAQMIQELQRAVNKWWDNR